MEIFALSVINYLLLRKRASMIFLKKINNTYGKKEKKEVSGSSKDNGLSHTGQV